MSFLLVLSFITRGKQWLVGSTCFRIFLNTASCRCLHCSCHRSLLFRSIGQSLWGQFGSFCPSDQFWRIADHLRNFAAICQFWWVTLSISIAIGQFGIRDWFTEFWLFAGAGTTVCVWWDSLTLLLLRFLGLLVMKNMNNLY